MATSEVKEMFTSEIAEVTDGGEEDDEFVLTEAHIAAIRVIFKEFDSDGSGTIEPPGSCRNYALLSATPSISMS